MAENTEPPQDTAAFVATALDTAAPSDDRVDAIIAMCDATPVSDAVHQALVALVADEDDDVRSEAIAALQHTATPLAIDALIDGLEREKRRNPRWVYGVAIHNLCEALGACGVGDPRAIDALVAQLRVEESMYASQGAFAALTAMGPAAARAKDALEQITREGRPWERAHAHLALWAQDGALERHVRALVPILAETKEGGGTAAAAAKLALEHIGEDAIAVLERPDIERGPLARHVKKVVESIRARAARKRGS